MMTKKEVAIQYVNFLEEGNINELLTLFRDNGMVDSPVYGIMNANEFYHALSNDTTHSKLSLKGIFEEKGANRLALYFHYIWTLKSNEASVL